jgi:hypothetical protein
VATRVSVITFPEALVALVPVPECLSGGARQRTSGRGSTPNWDPAPTPASPQGLVTAGAVPPQNRSLNDFAPRLFR